MRKLISNSRLVIILLIILLLGAAISRFGFLFAPMLASDSNPVILDIPAGSSLITVAWQLKRQGLLKNPDYFVAFARVRGDLDKMKAGEYLIQPDKTTPISFLSDIIAGQILLRQLTLIEGWTFAQVMQAVNTNPYLTHTLAGLNDADIMAKLGYSGVNPEGRFFPDTYLFGKGTSDTKILTKAYRKMDNLLATQWNGRAPRLPYQNASEALTVASLIERETAIAAERPMIAGVIVRRLQKNMRLQIDPTVIFALGTAYRGKLTSADMRIDSPYNTYLHAGLPPTPIGLPSAASINAALHPAPGNALYYVSNRFGRHVFSATLKQHDAAIDQYLLNPRFCFSGSLFFARLRVAAGYYSPTAVPANLPRWGIIKGENRDSPP